MVGKWVSNGWLSRREENQTLTLSHQRKGVCNPQALWGLRVKERAIIDVGSLLCERNMLHQGGAGQIYLLGTSTSIFVELPTPISGLCVSIRTLQNLGW